LSLTLLATERCRGGQLVLSLAGGRKTMSADLQMAGSVFGTAALLHVVGPEPLPADLCKAEPALFVQPLPSALAAAIAPLVVGTGRRDELIDIEIDGRRVVSEHFPLPLADGRLSWPEPAEGAMLAEEIAHRQAQGSRLLGNFHAVIAQQEHHENWRNLYRLSPALIERLRRQTLEPADRNWLIALPKADLHRHLGGCLDLTAQRRVAEALWSALSATEQALAGSRCAELLALGGDWPWDWPQRYKALPPAERAACSAALLRQADPARLERQLYGLTEPRLALKDRHARGFEAYERPGELSGSAILGHSAALPAYARELVEQARAEGLLYVELRGSPHKYRPDAPATFVGELAAALRAAGARFAVDEAGDAPILRFLWILDRRQQSDDMRDVVQQAVDAHEAHPDFLAGLDLAGDEVGMHAAADWATIFEAAHRACLPLTIHAGEGQPPENIWEAAYRLHADRIGHGLTLAEHPALAARFRDRGILLELCPTSNREVVGYRDPDFAGSDDLPAYPLRRFLADGLPLTLCTDNPGISRTTLADEYLAAARMSGEGLSEGGLNRWQALALIKQAFSHAFLPAAERERLLKAADARVFARLSEEGE